MTFEQTLFVGLAGLEQPRAVQAAGALKLALRGSLESGQFAYGQRYLERPDALALNPLHLPLRPEVLDLPARLVRDGGALPLTLLDALPDRWGRRVLEAQHQRHLSNVETLLLTNADRVGAMVFGSALPLPSLDALHTFFTLDELAQAAHQLELGQAAPEQLAALLQGGSLGGARPKATFIHQGRRHLAKFAARGDDHNVPVLEALTLQLAQHCGINVPPFFVQQLPNGEDVLVLQRFDRVGPVEQELRLHYLSASAVLDVPYEDNSRGSYVELAQALRRLSVQPQADLEQLFRRMVFNLLVGNSDDHIKNHGVLMQPDGQYRLAPAFDLVMQLNTYTGYQGLALAPQALHASIKTVHQISPHFGLDAAQAQTLIEELQLSIASQAPIILENMGEAPSLKERVLQFLKRVQMRIHD